MRVLAALMRNADYAREHGERVNDPTKLIIAVIVLLMIVIVVWPDRGGDDW